MLSLPYGHFNKDPVSINSSLDSSVDLGPLIFRVIFFVAVLEQNLAAKPLGSSNSVDSIDGVKIEVTLC